MLNILVKLTLSEPSLKLGGKVEDKYELVVLRGDAHVAAGTVACTLMINPHDALGAQFPRVVNVDYCDWPDFSASRMLSRNLDVDHVYNVCSGLWPGTELLLQCEIGQRAGDRGRQILGINIIDAQVLTLPPVEAIEAAQKPNLLASLVRAASNGRMSPGASFTAPTAPTAPSPPSTDKK